MKGIIFDLDGVICHTDEYHYLAWKAMADSLNIPFDRQVNNRLRGVSRMASLEIILESFRGQLSQAEKEALADQKNERYKESLKNMSTADLSPEVKTTLEALRERGYALAIGSSSKNARFILQQLGLGNFFDAVSDGNNIVNSKPDPEVFVKAAQMLCLPCEECLVVEDAVSGAIAGKRGGMQVACVGDAAKEQAGDYNLTAFAQLLEIAR